MHMIMETIISIIIFTTLTSYYGSLQPVVYDVIGYDGFQDSIKVASNHIPKRNWFFKDGMYFCPKYCKSIHTHMAHPVGWMCDMNNGCNRYMYHVPPDSIQPIKPHLYK